MAPSSPSYLDWIVPHGVTQFYGPVGIGKTTLLEGLLTEWRNGSAYLLHPETHRFGTKTETSPFHKRVRAIVKVRSLDKLVELMHRFKKSGLSNTDLLLIDDTSAFRLEEGSPGAATHIWIRVLQFLREQGVTTVIGTVAHRTSGQTMNTPTGRGMALVVDARYEMEELARGDDHFILQVWTRKSKTEMAGGIKGRLWVRPKHEVRVRAT